MNEVEQKVNEAWKYKNWPVFDKLLEQNPKLRYNGTKWYLA